ncbi:MAG: response regulator [Candidatus Sungbacteria bacterium]|nr:response regulator [Candidatus Sungbacteria bacterium]
MSKKILFIEDESALQRAASTVLTEKGYTVLSALDGELGIAAAKKEMPDLILLDLILPKKDGFEVLKDLKADPATQTIPVIILSNLAESADVERALTLGARTYLVKTNYRLEEVVEKIDGILQ